MIRAAVLIALVLASTAAHADEPRAGDRAFVELRTDRTTRFVGEAVEVRVRVGFDAEWFATSAVPLFRQEVDVPLHVRIPWLDDLPGTTRLTTPPDDASAPPIRVALNDAVVLLRRAPDEIRGERRFHVFELARRFAPLGADRLTVEGPALRFAYATRFEEGFLDERVPLDRREAGVAGDALVLTVSPVPALGRPPAFVDAIGRFRLTARADATTVAVEETLRLTLVLEGSGNLEIATPPGANRFDGFHVYGVIDDKRAARRTITYELSPLRADVAAIPAIPFAYFDPTPPARFHSTRTEAIDLGVTGGAPAGTPAPGDPPTEAPSIDPASSPRAPKETPRLLFVLVGGLLVLFLAALTWAIVLRRRLVAERQAETDASAERAAAAREALRAVEQASAADRERALIEYIAAELECPAAAVVSPGLRRRLTDAGVPDALAARAAHVVEALVAARYGAPPEVAASGSDAGLASELAAAFRSTRGTR